jgi:hypothetical protein
MSRDALDVLGQQIAWRQITDIAHCRMRAIDRDLIREGIMASGHVNRVNRPNTWLHRPMLQTFKKVLANSEPSTHGAKRTLVGTGTESVGT